MPFWPFKKKRSSASKDGASNIVSEKPAPARTSRTTASGNSTSPAPIVPRRSSKRNSQRKRRASDEKDSPAARIENKKRPEYSEKSNSARPRSSIEDITALPLHEELQTSPHLRPADLELPHIPYNFRQLSTPSQTSMQPPEAEGRSSRPQTLRSKRSAYDTAPQRRRSSKKRKDGHLREEEIRAMSAPIPIPRRPGAHSEGPLRRESKKLRSVGRQDSNVSLPMEESIHSSMSGVIEQRGWEVGGYGLFTPRPRIRLSGVPQYGSFGSPSTYQDPSLVSRDGSKKDKRPLVSRDAARKNRTIDALADNLDATDLRMLMERDQRRRDRRQKEKQEKLDRKLRRRADRQRGEEIRRRIDEDEKRTEQQRQRAEEEQRTRALMTPPTDVHPALREPTEEAVGLGIGEGVAMPLTVDPEQQRERVIPTTEEQGTDNTGTYLNYPAQGNSPENPFTDPAPETTEPGPSSPGLDTYTPVETPMEDPVVGTAQAVRMPQTATPPLSPIQSTRLGSSMSQLTDIRTARTQDLPGPSFASTERRTSEPKERRAGAWATFFKRGGTNLKRASDEPGRSSPSEFSFSNTSRESMSRQPLPAHLVQPTQRMRSTTPQRTQSKFREDLPEMPVSPPDSRVQSPDLPAAAAAQIAAARRGKRSPKPTDIPGSSSAVRDSFPDPLAQGRTDSPVSPSGRTSAGLMSTSLASVDSEGSWLAGGAGKRSSHQSALSRSVGSLSKRRQDFSASYEELPGGMSDEEYFRRQSPDARRALHGRKVSSSALTGASPDEESEYGDVARPVTPGGPLTVHDSVRRQPTLVRRDPRVRSKEGLVADYLYDDETPDVDDESEMQADLESPPASRSEVRSATSINYGKAHARQMSAGSAKLLDIPPSKRPSMDTKRDSSAHSAPFP